MWKVETLVVTDINPTPLKRHKESIETYIPSIKKHLPHTWIDLSLSTATASKADDAAAPCRLWDARLELLFTGCTSHLAWFSNLLTQAHASSSPPGNSKIFGAQIWAILGCRTPKSPFVFISGPNGASRGGYNFSLSCGQLNSASLAATRYISML